MSGGIDRDFSCSSVIASLVFIDSFMNTFLIHNTGCRAGSSELNCSILEIMCSLLDNDLGSLIDRVTVFTVIALLTCFRAGSLFVYCVSSFPLVSIGINRNLSGGFMSTSFMCIGFDVGTDRIHHTLCTTRSRGMYSVILVYVSSLFDRNCGFGIDYAAVYAMIAHLTVSITRCLPVYGISGCPLMCVGVFVRSGSGCITRQIFIGSRVIALLIHDTVYCTSRRLFDSSINKIMLSDFNCDYRFGVDHITVCTVIAHLTRLEAGSLLVYRIFGFPTVSVGVFVNYSCGCRSTSLVFIRSLVRALLIHSTGQLAGRRSIYGSVNVIMRSLCNFSDRFGVLGIAVFAMIALLTYFSAGSLLIYRELAFPLVSGGNDRKIKRFCGIVACRGIISGVSGKEFRASSTLLVLYVTRSATSRSLGANRFKGMAKGSGNILRYKYCITYRTVLTLGKTGCGTGCGNHRVDHFGMFTRCRNCNLIAAELLGTYGTVYYRVIRTVFSAGFGNRILNYSISGSMNSGCGNFSGFIGRSALTCNRRITDVHARRRRNCGAISAVDVIPLIMT